MTNVDYLRVNSSLEIYIDGENMFIRFNLEIAQYC